MLLIILLAANATSERSFSALRRVKSTFLEMTLDILHSEYSGLSINGHSE